MSSGTGGQEPVRRTMATPFVCVDPKSIPRRQWLYRPDYIRKFVSLTISTGGVGKSSLIIAEALAMVSGKPLLGVKPERKLRVWYWNGEDPYDELQRRIAAAMKHYELTADDIGDRLFVDSGRTTEIVIANETRRNTWLDRSLIARIIAIIQSNEIDVVLIDPFVASHRVPENDNSAIELVAKTWSQIADEANCSVMLVHHSRKTGGEGASVEDGRGASALLAAARSARTLNTMTKGEASNARVDDEGERRSYFRGDTGKTNMTRPAEEAKWYKQASVDLENHGTLGWGDEVGVVTAWSYPKLKQPTMTPSDISRALALIEAGGPWRLDQRAINEPWIGRPIAEAFGVDLGDKLNRKVIRPIITDGLAGGWLVKEDRPDKKGTLRSYIKAGTLPSSVKQAEEN